MLSTVHAGGRFRLGEHLGAGAFGEVYRARDLDRDVEVALKVLRGVQPEAMYRLKREFRALVQLSHPNLVSLYELLYEEGVWWLSMEYVPGVDFLSWVRGTRSQVDADRLRDALCQLVAGLSALHQAGYVHRDVTPGNVRITPAGRLVVLDFGLVGDVDPIDPQSSIGVVGSPLYMSPEQATGGPVTPASDWYGVGTLLFEALTGRRPFEGDPVAVILAKRAQPAPDPLAYNPTAPPDLAALSRRLLARAPRARPRPEDILARLGAPSGQSKEPLAQAEAPFVGRHEELVRLEGAYRAMTGGQTVVVHVRGAPGMGKSALIEHFVANLVRREPDAAIFTGRCYEQEHLPFRAFDGVIDALSRYLRALPEDETRHLLPRDLPSVVRVFPVLRRVAAMAGTEQPSQEPADAHEVRRQAFTALRDLFARLTQRRPIVLCIDDLQWADLDSVDLWRALLRPPDSPPLLLVVSYPVVEVDANPVLRELLGDPTGRVDIELNIGPLAAAEASHLASLLWPEDSKKAAAVAVEGRGNPLFIGQLAWAGRHAGLSRQLRLEEVIRTGIDALSEGARRVLGALAVAGIPLELATVFEAASVTGRDPRVVRELLRARFVRTRVGGPGETQQLEVYHDRIRHVVVAALEDEGRRRLHARLGTILEDTIGVDPEVVADHFRRAGDRLRAAHYMRLAADRASRATAFGRAVRLYRETLELIPTEADERRRALQEALGEALANAGRGAEAADAFLAAVGDTTSVTSLVLRQRAASQLLFSGRLTPGREVMRSVWADVGLHEPKRPALAFLARRLALSLRPPKLLAGPPVQRPEREQVRLEACFNAGAALGITDAIYGAYFATQHAVWVGRSSDPVEVARALDIDLVTHAFWRGPAARRRVQRLAARARELIEGLDDPRLVADHNLAMAIAECNAGRWRSCLAYSERAGEIYRQQCTGVWWFQYTAHAMVVLAHALIGDLAELGARVSGWIGEAAQRGDVYSVTTLRSLSFMEWLARDDVEGGRRMLEAAMADWDHPGFHVQHRNALWGEALLDLYGAEPDSAARRITRALPALRRTFRMHIDIDRVLFYRLRATAYLAQAAQQMHRPSHMKRLIRAARWDMGRLRRNRLAEGNAHAHLLTGSVALLTGRPGRAVELFGLAEAAFDALDMILHAAAAKRARGRILGGDEGKALVDDADAFMRSQTIQNPERMAASIVPYGTP